MTKNYKLLNCVDCKAPIKYGYVRCNDCGKKLMATKTPCWKCGDPKSGLNQDTKRWECFDCYYHVKTNENGDEYMDLKIEKIVS